MTPTDIHPCGTPGLGYWDRVACYCERGADPGFWAEPLNALSNLAFIVAALMAYADLRSARAERGVPVLVAMIVLVMAVGVGSFLFHTFATRWAALADVVPIGLFVFAYVALAWTWFVGAAPWAALAIALGVTVATFQMPPGLNGSLMYAPALAMLVATAALLGWRRHRAWPWIASAAGVFLVSLTFRTLDRTDMMCGPHAIGSHWAWHVLNAATLYLLLRGAIEHVRPAEHLKPRSAPGGSGHEA